MAWQEAVLEDAEGVRLLLETVPGAAATLFPAGFNPWRGRIKVRVQAAAHGGRANQELRQTVATFFGLPLAWVEITAGATDRRKEVLLRALPRSEVLRLLAVSFSSRVKQE